MSATHNNHIQPSVRKDPHKLRHNPLEFGLQQLGLADVYVSFQKGHDHHLQTSWEVPVLQGNWNKMADWKMAASPVEELVRYSSHYLLLQFSPASGHQYSAVGQIWYWGNSGTRGANLVTIFFLIIIRKFAINYG